MQPARQLSSNIEQKFVDDVVVSHFMQEGGCLKFSGKTCKILTFCPHFLPFLPQLCSKICLFSYAPKFVHFLYGQFLTFDVPVFVHFAL